MTKRIIYKNDEGGVSIIIPTPEVLQDYTVEEVALKDVPAGKPFKIVDVNTIPTDRTFRNAWEVNEAELTDGVGAESNEFPVREEE
jgi:hypothetical protein